MKQIIEGKLYNSATAKLIGEGSSDCGSSDFNHYDEALYVTKRGAYFIKGVGGPCSRWARCVGNGYTGSSGIQAIDADEALEWAERHLTASEIESAFGSQLEEA